MYEYIAPYAAATIGPWEVNKLAGVGVYSSRINPIDLAEITIPAEGVALDAITKGMPVTVAQGYREKGMWPTFAGRVDDISSGRVVTIFCKDRMEDLRKVKITKSFVDAVPQEIVKYAMGQAGIENFALGLPLLPRRHHFVSRSLNIIQLVNMVTRTWGLTDWAFYFEPDGKFCWQPWQESDRYNGGQPVATLEYGQNLLELVPSDEQTGKLKTFSLPFIKHSNLLILRDRRFWSAEVLVRAERIHYAHGEKATEMEIEWRIQRS